jgi:hypothetical protein
MFLKLAHYALMEVYVRLEIKFEKKLLYIFQYQILDHIPIYIFPVGKKCFQKKLDQALKITFA